MRIAPVVVVMVLAAGCGGSSADDADESTVARDDTSAAITADPADTETTAEQRFPDVVDVTATAGTDGWDFDTTLSSPYDTPERYADAWRVLAPDGTVLGIRELLHDHQNEQPFTRSLRGVEIPDGIDVVTVEGRDSDYGWGGTTMDVVLRP